MAFEHLILNEIIAWINYSKDRRSVTFWRDRSGNEVDFIIGDSCAIEVKGTNMVQEKHLRGLKILSEEITLKHKIIVSLDSKPRLIGNIRILPWKIFLKELWNGVYL